MPDDRHSAAKRQSAPETRLGRTGALMMFGLFIVIALCAGLVFNIVSVALPKIVDERINNISLIAVGGLTTAVFIAGALAQLAVGRLVERFVPHILLMFVTALLFAGVLWSAHASGPMLMVALMVAMTGIYGQVTVNDVVIARFTADAWRGRVYAVRYFLVFISSGAAVATIAFLHGRGGFDLVLLTTAAIALAFFVATIGVTLVAAASANRAVPAPAE
jgi:MFS family permease